MSNSHFEIPKSPDVRNEGVHSRPFDPLRKSVTTDDIEGSGPVEQKSRRKRAASFGASAELSDDPLQLFEDFLVYKSSKEATKILDSLSRKIFEKMDHITKVKVELFQLEKKINEYIKGSEYSREKELKDDAEQAFNDKIKKLDEITKEIEKEENKEERKKEIEAKRIEIEAKRIEIEAKKSNMNENTDNLENLEKRAEPLESELKQLKENKEDLEMQQKTAAGEGAILLTSEESLSALQGKLATYKGQEAKIQREISRVNIEHEQNELKKIEGEDIANEKNFNRKEKEIKTLEKRKEELNRNLLEIEESLADFKDLDESQKELDSKISDSDTCKIIIEGIIQENLIKQCREVKENEMIFNKFQIILAFRDISEQEQCDIISTIERMDDLAIYEGNNNGFENLISENFQGQKDYLGKAESTSEEYSIQDTYTSKLKGKRLEVRNIHLIEIKSDDEYKSTRDEITNLMNDKESLEETFNEKARLIGNDTYKSNKKAANEYIELALNRYENSCKIIKISQSLINYNRDKIRKIRMEDNIPKDMNVTREINAAFKKEGLGDQNTTSEILPKIQDGYKERLSNLEEEILQIQEHIEKGRQKQSKYKQTENDIVETEKRITEVTEDKESARKKLQSAQARYGIQKKKVADLQLQVDSSRRSQKDQIEQIKQIEQQISSITAQVELEARLTEQIQAKETERDGIRQQQDAIARDIQQTRMHITRLERECANHSQIIEGLRGEQQVALDRMREASSSKRTATESFLRSDAYNRLRALQRKKEELERQKKDDSKSLKNLQQEEEVWQTKKRELVNRFIEP